MVSFMAIDLKQEMPYKLKDLNQFAFSKSVKNLMSYSISAISNVSFHKFRSVQNYVLSEQYQT